MPQFAVKILMDCPFKNFFFTITYSYSIYYPQLSSWHPKIIYNTPTSPLLCASQWHFSRNPYTLGTSLNKGDLQSWFLYITTSHQLPNIFLAKKCMQILENHLLHHVDLFAVYIVSFYQGFISGFAWICIHFASWIQIRIQYANPDPEGQKKIKMKIEKMQRNPSLFIMMAPPFYLAIFVEGKRFPFTPPLPYIWS